MGPRIAALSNTQTVDKDAEVITAESYIATLLQRLVSEGLLITVSFPHNPGSRYTTTVLRTLPAEGLFLLDDLFPQSLPEPIAEGAQLNLEARFEGASLDFSAELKSLREEQGLRFWYVKMPASIRYQQARTEHRVIVSSLEIPVRLYLGEGVVQKGRLYDLCAQGVGIHLAKVAGLKKGRPYRCSIDHSDDESVEVEIVLTRAEKVAGALPVQLGANLHNMSRQDMLQWQRFVAEIERRVLRGPQVKPPG